MKTKKPSKQRKRLYKGKMHERRTVLTSHLSKELRKETGKRSMLIRTGDKIKIMRGTHKKKEGKIVKVNHKKAKIFIDKITRKKADGTEKLIPIKASNLLITEIERKDEKRFKRTGIKAKKEETKKTEDKKREEITEKKELIKEQKKEVAEKLIKENKDTKKEIITEKKPKEGK